MRVTNGMMRTNSMLNMQRNKVAYDKYLQQYNTQKKIQRPSDDPTIAVRALKYRTTLIEIDQYQRNIEDATSWMDATETAIRDVDKVLDNMVQYVTQAATGTVNAKDRADITKQLDQYAQYIYEQDLNSDYAGRYLFTGYRTDSPLLFDEAQGKDFTKNVRYTIHEQLDVNDIKNYSYVYGRAEYGATKSAQDYAGEAPQFLNTNRILVSYQDLLDPTVNPTTRVTNLDGTQTDVANMTPVLVYKDRDGNECTLNVTVKNIVSDAVYNDHLHPKTKAELATMTPAGTPTTVTVTPKGGGTATTKTTGEVYIVPETGELVFADDIYDDIRGGSDLMITYQKNEFDKNDIRPEHYFTCETLDAGTAEQAVYNTDPDNKDKWDVYSRYNFRPQNIQYQINFSQTIAVNTEGRNAVGTEVGRGIEDIKNSCNELDVIEAKMSEVEKRISDLDEGADADKIKDLTELKTQLQTQMDLQKSVLVKALGSMITTIQGAKDEINVALADHGSRYNRMVMTKNKISELEIDTNQAKSDNEDADLGEAYINFTESNLLYQATLNATSKVLGQSLLDFI
ncbi:MAG: hypothetical protein J5819_10365 [Eubacterium sp.]|nr:hypothetical protein [Eubacterium sp.]